MAPRGEIKDAFYAELVDAATGTYDVVDASGTVVDTVTVEEDDVELLQVEEEETLPQVLWDESYSPVMYNGCGAGPEMRTYEADGETVKEYIWREYTEAQFTVFVRARNEGVKEPIYDAVRSRFGRFGHGPWHEEDLHADVLDISVGEETSVDVGDTEDVIRGDQIEIFVTFHRDYPLDADNIDSVQTDVEGSTYTTN